jgi:hypothetical protein
VRIAARSAFHCHGRIFWRRGSQASSKNRSTVSVRALSLPPAHPTLGQGARPHAAGLRNSTEQLDGLVLRLHRSRGRATGRGA